MDMVVFELRVEIIFLGDLLSAFVPFLSAWFCIVYSAGYGTALLGSTFAAVGSVWHDADA